MVSNAVAHHVVHHAAGSVSIGALVGYVVGGAGAVVAYVTHRIERRRTRPVVICHESRKRALEGSIWKASVTISNESAASAFNIRFGVKINDTHVGWKHDDNDPGPSRLNVLRPDSRWPGASEPPIGIVIPDAVVFSGSLDKDPDEGRIYWAYYQSPGGDWWYTSNPASRDEDLTITRLRSRRFTLSRHKRILDRRIREGEKVIRDIGRELREATPPAGSDGE
jgi:hypothetical protein